MTDIYELNNFLVAPLRNDLDSLASKELSRDILSYLQKKALKTVIFDFTAVSVLDRKTFLNISECTKMIGLMGAASVFSCIQPGVASAMVDLDLECPVQTCQSLEELME